MLEKEGVFWKPDPFSKELDCSLSNFDSVSLQDMADAALMKRMDTKFVIRSSDLDLLLRAVEKEYSVLEIDGLRSHAYASLYFDTPEQKFYKDHHNRKLRRSKVRMRKYLDSESSFFEIKQKDAKGQTSKSRCPIIDLNPGLTTENKYFVKKTLKQDLQLIPTVNNAFHRITLVHNRNRERVTIDRQIRFFYGDNHKLLDGVAVVEIKQERVNRDTAVYQELKRKNFRPMRISKYCIGMVNLFPGVKYNRFKQKMIHINKIS